MKISFLIHGLYGLGGTNRTTVNLAAALADRHQIEVASVFRHRDTPLFEIDPRITVVPLVDVRKESPSYDGDHPTHRQPAELFPRNEARFKEYSKLTDARVAEYLAGSDADVVIGTRPGLTAYLAQLAPPHVLRVGQEHMTHDHHSAALHKEMRPHLAALDAFVTVSAADAEVYRQRMPLPETRVLHIPNSVPEPRVTPSDTTGKTVVAAGRLADIKCYEVLIAAFEKVVAERPDWELRIYGSGTARGRLRGQINELGLYNRVFLMGPRSPIETEWAKGALAASTSRLESFGMTIVEAMRCGLPVVSTACDHGPPEIIKDGEDGVLVPVGDVGAVAAALLDLIDDEDKRRRMGKAARANARRYDPARIAEQYESLIDRLSTAKALRPRAHLVTDFTGALLVRFEEVLTGYEEMTVQCRHRAGTAATVSVPLRRVEADLGGPTRLEAVLHTGGEPLAEGDWDIVLERATDGARRRVRAILCDQRYAMAGGPRRGRTPISHQVPYVTEDGCLAIRSWLRAVHAEAGDIRVADEHIRFRGRLHGADFATEVPVLLARRRGTPSHVLELPAERGDGGEFRCEVPCAAPAGHRGTEHDVWDLWLRYDDTAEPVRIARFLDDVVEKKEVFSYPITVLTRTVEEKPQGRFRKKPPGPAAHRMRVRPYYTVSNELSVNVVDLP